MIDIKHKLCNTREEYQRGKRERIRSLQALRRRLAFLEERAEQRGFLNGFDQQEAWGLQYALDCMSEEYDEFRACNAQFSEQKEDQAL